MKLEFPQKKHKIAYEKLINEWGKIEDLSEISPWALFYWDNFEDFLETINLYKEKSPTSTNSTLFLLIENEEIIWWVDIRNNINHSNLKERWWHIWYWIAPKFRKKWYATKMLKLALVECKKLWLGKVLITCSINNIGSKKVIEKNWWIFERLTIDWTANRYWIDL